MCTFIVDDAAYANYKAGGAGTRASIPPAPSSPSEESPIYDNGEEDAAPARRGSMYDNEGVVEGEEPLYDNGEGGEAFVPDLATMDREGLIQFLDGKQIDYSGLGLLPDPEALRALASSSYSWTIETPKHLGR